MKQIATVKEIQEDGKALVVVKRQTMCEACHKDASGCAACSGQISVSAVNAAGAGVGDTVEVDTSSKQIFAAAAVVFLLPIAAAVAGYFVAVRGFSAGSSSGCLVAFLSAVFFLLLTAVVIKISGIAPSITVTRIVESAGASLHEGEDMPSG